MRYISKVSPFVLSLLFLVISAIPGHALKPRAIVAIGIAQDTGHVYAWYKNGTVSSGTSNDLAKHKRPYKYVLPEGYEPRDIAGITLRPIFVADTKSVLFKLNGIPATYVFYKNGKYSIGTSNNLAKYQQPKSYTLPTGKSPKDIVGVSYSKREKMTFDSTERNNKDMAFFVFFKDGTVTAGFRPQQLDSFRKPYQYVTPTGISPTDIKGMGCAPDTRYHYGWYNDNTVSAGSSDNLDRYRKRYNYTLP